MDGLVIAFLGSEDAARELGKRGTSTDITYFNLKKGDRVLTTMVPVRYPERIQPLAHILGIAHVVVFEISELGPALGEQVIAARHSGHRKCMLILRNYISEEQIAPLFKDAMMEYQVFQDERQLREALEAMSPPQGEGEGVTVIDQSFSVKGVGTVVLGFVIGGVARKHDKAKAHPGGKEAIIRSIQAQDEDQESAGIGTRVGYALRGVEPEDVPRGALISTKEFKEVQKAALKLERTKYWKGSLETGTVLHLCQNFQFVPSRVEAIEGDSIQVVLDKPMVYSGGPLLVLQLDSGKQRVVGGGSFLIS
ncbi:MAG: hypothetical protein QCI38_07360 [Candidatus Thermoplasmatota archaeon]|nr:hypothetical protein [Candidatus Thermoplasmatota archaeon]